LAKAKLHQHQRNRPPEKLRDLPLIWDD